MLFHIIAAMLFDRRFSRLRAGMSPTQVEAVIGKPSAVEQETLPADSTFGLQPAFKYKIPAGGKCLTWRYLRGNRTFLAFFALDGEPKQWRLSLNLSYPSVVDGR